MKATSEPVFFASPVEFRDWLAEWAGKASDLWVGFYKKGTGKPTLTWPEAVDQALCFGWIDGIRKGIDRDSYKIRFTPRKLGSTWSIVNINRIEELDRLGLVQPSGLTAYSLRQEKRSGIYAYEQTEVAQLSAPEENQFRANPTAWEFFQDQPASYRKAKYWWVVSSKKPETRQKRLVNLIEACLQHRRI